MYHKKKKEDETAKRGNKRSTLYNPRKCLNKKENRIGFFFCF